jgi:hypothetical protein
VPRKSESVMNLRDINSQLVFMRKGLAGWIDFSRFRLSTSREMAINFAKFAVATAILIFYSRNIVSAAIRTWLGA